nr:uncharacterized protein LOC129445257 [Misgurnus anguillicaudatus]
MFALFSLICLLVIPGMCSQNWTVKYSSRVKCAVKGSATLLSGSFTYPDGLNITKIFWTIDPVKDEETPDLSEDPEYKDRVKYILDKKQNLILKLSNVTDKDEHKYYMKIVTNVEKQEYLGYPGVQLNVTELSVEIPEEVVEGKSAVLLCKTTCILANSTKYIWYKNKSPLSESFSSNKLILQSVSRDDEGNYSCAVRGDEHLKSPAVTLTVRSNNNTVLHITAGIVAALICICIAIVTMRIISRKIADTGIRSDRSKQENISVTMTDQISSHLTSYDPKTTNDLMYTITFQRPSASNGDQNDEDADEVQYVCVNHHKTTQKNNIDAEAQFGNVINHCPAISSRSNFGLVEDSSVIYSGINVP